MKRTLLVLALLCPLSALAQVVGGNGGFSGGNIGSNSSPVERNIGQALPGASISICQPMVTTSASVTNNLAVLVMTGNPQASGFTVGMQIMVSGFSGADTVFNGGSIVNGQIVGGFTIISVTPTTLMYPLTASNQTASTAGTVLQQGSSMTPCAGLSSIFSDPGLSNSLIQPILSDAFGNWNAFAQPGVYYGQFYGPGITTTIKQFSIACVPGGQAGTCGASVNSILAGNNAWLGNQTHAGSETFTGPIVTSGSIAATGPIADIPSLSTCATVAGIVNVQAPPGAGQPTGIASQCVGLYSSIAADATRTNVWGENPIAIVHPSQASGYNVWGSESDVDVATTATGQAVGYDAVATAGFRGDDGTITSATTRPTWAFHAFAAELGSQPWGIGFACDNPGAACFGFQPPDTGLKITQSITANAGPQNVTTNAVYALNRLNTGAWITIDTGATNQEDVQVLSLTCTVGQTLINSCPPPSGVGPGNNLIINAVFSKNHANNTGFSQYSSDRLWDASTAFSRFPTYRVGDLRNYINTSNPLGWSVLDTTGTDRLYDAILSNGVSGGPANERIFRDVGGGWQFQNISGVGLLNIASTGNVQMFGSLTIPNGSTFSALDFGGTSRLLLALNTSNVVVLEGQPTQKEIALQPNPNTTRLDVTDTAVTVSGVPLTSATGLGPATNVQWTSGAGVPGANCGVGSLYSNTSASSASTALYVCYPANTWNAVTVP